MSTFQKKSWRLIILLLALAVTIFLTLGSHRSDIVEAVATTDHQTIGNAESTPARRQVGTLDISALRQRNLPTASPSLFGTSVAVPPSATLNLLPPPPSKPSAPPLPYTYLGQYRDDDGVLVFYLRRGDEVLVAKPGTELDQSYRLESDLSHGLTITYLPLKEAHIIPIGTFAP